MPTTLAESTPPVEAQPQPQPLSRRANAPWSRERPAVQRETAVDAGSADTNADVVYQGQSQQQTLEDSQKGLISMLEEDNPYMQLARKQGARLAESRGLGGSTLRERASQGAAIESALPLVQQAGQEASAERQQAQQLTASTQQQQAEIASTELRAQAADKLQRDMQTIDVDYKQWLEGVTYKHQGILQGNAQAAGAYSDFSAAAMNILNNPETTSEQKKASVAALKEALNGSLEIIGATADIDLSKFLPATVSPADTGATAATAATATPETLSPADLRESNREDEQVRLRNPAGYIQHMKTKYPGWEAPYAR